MDNYIVINGKKAELTEEQLIRLGIKANKDPFEWRDDDYYFINSMGEITSGANGVRVWNSQRYEVANYCSDDSLLKQRALHEALQRLLWRYSMQHDGDKINYADEGDIKYHICYDFDEEDFVVYNWQVCNPFNSISFYTKDIAKNAIREIIKPFLEKHPEFKW